VAGGISHVKKTAIGLALAGVLEWFAFSKTKRRRDTHHEIAMDAAAVHEYNRIANWPIFKLQRRTVMDTLKKMHPAWPIVDIGCGPGYLTNEIRQVAPEVIGLDIDPEMLRVARTNWKDNLGFIQADVQQLPFRTGSTGCVVSSLSMHHWPDSRVALEEIVRVLQPGGQFLLFDLSRENSRFFYFMLWAGQNFLAPPDIRRTRGGTGSLMASYTSKEFKNMLSGLPLKSYSVRQQSFWLLGTGQKL
jgi:ubiquinone/menaquinone biosynthesis C-methylase UbiE